MVSRLPFDRLRIRVILLIRGQWLGECRIRVRLRWISIILLIRGQWLGECRIRVILLIRGHWLALRQAQGSRPTSLDKYNPLNSWSVARRVPDSRPTSRIVV